MTVDPGILTGLGVLAFVGVVAVLAVVGAWLLAPRAGDVDIPAPDVDVRERLAPFTGRGNVVRHDAHDPAACDACAGRDRGSF